MFKFSPIPSNFPEVIRTLGYLYRIVFDKILLICYFIAERVSLLFAGLSCGIVILYVLRGQINWSDYRLIAALVSYPLFEFVAVRLTNLRQEKFKDLTKRCRCDKYFSAQKRYLEQSDSLYRKLYLHVLDFDIKKYSEYSHVSYSIILAILFSCLHLSFFILLVSLLFFLLMLYIFAKHSIFNLDRNKYKTSAVEFYSLFKGVPKLLPSLCLFFILLLGLGISSLVSSTLDLKPPSWFVSLFALFVFRQIFASLRILFLRTNTTSNQDDSF